MQGLINRLIPVSTHASYLIEHELMEISENSKALSFENWKDDNFHAWSFCDINEKIHMSIAIKTRGIGYLVYYNVEDKDCRLQYGFTQDKNELSVFFQSKDPENKVKFITDLNLSNHPKTKEFFSKVIENFDKERYQNQ